ncbi:MAG: ABC transporter permease [Verrucomicrobia bacterium]|nr:ABC transporter permease [Verrucomicrobiota bacterium]
MARNTWGAREMIAQLLKRDLTAQYKKSHIGILWMLAGPIMSVIPWLFAAKVQLYNPGALTVPLAVYLIVGRAMWGLFSGSYANGTSTLGSGGGLLMQVSFPHEAMLTKQFIQGITGFSLTLVTCIVVMLVHRVIPPWQALLFPLTILPIFFLGAAMGLIIGLINMVAYDLSRVINILFGFLMWTTPLLYSDKIPSPFLQVVIKYNPLTYLICTARDVLIHGHVYNHQVGIYALCVATATALFLISLRLFYVSEQKLVERMI